jgi:hypothetical protein
VKPRFRADADLNHAIVRGIKRREPTVDFRSAHQPVPLEGMEDVDVLALAAREAARGISRGPGRVTRHRWVRAALL